MYESNLEVCALLNAIHTHTACRTIYATVRIQYHSVISHHHLLQMHASSAKTSSFYCCEMAAQTVH